MKMLVIDDISYVGSANLDLRSLYLNLEIMLRIESPEVAEHLRGLVETMKEEAEERKMTEIKKQRGPFSMALYGISYLAVGIIDYSVTRTFGFPFKRDKKNAS